MIIRVPRQMPALSDFGKGLRVLFGAGLVALLAADCGPKSDGPPIDESPRGSAATEDLARDCVSIRDSAHPQLGEVPLRAVQAEIARFAAGETVVPGEDLELFLRAAARALDQADFDSTFTYLRRASELVDRFPTLADQTDRVAYQWILAELRYGEVQNCSTPDAPAVCLFVPGADRGFRKTDWTESAIGRLEAILERSPDDLEAHWLLNLAHMSLRTYPDGVPVRWRIEPPSEPAPPGVPRFDEIGHQLGVATTSLLGGAIMDDFDGDGLLDLFETSYDPCRSVRLYRNDGEQGLTEVTEEAGLVGQLGGFNTQQTDYDNDGRRDIFITRGGWQASHGRHRNSLLRNRGDGTFEDVTALAGLAAPAYPTQASAWADFDADGDLDLYIGNEMEAEDPDQLEGAVIFPSQLFRNNGDGTFTDVAPAAGVTNDRMAKGVAWGDIDNDGDDDLYVSNLGANRLYLNLGDGTFTDVAAERGVTEPVGRSFATWFWDMDNDGDLDLYCAGYRAGLEEIVADYLGRETSGERPRLYRNDGSGFFEDVTEAAGLDHVVLPMGTNFGDIDNDGWLDIYLGTGNPLLEMQVPNVLLWNDRGGRFVDVTVPTQTGHLPKGHGVAFGDLDNDHDQDIFLQAGGFVPGEQQPNAFFANPGNERRALALDLVGVSSNRAAIGARIELVVEDGADGVRSIHRVVGSGSSFGANSLRAEIGVGDASVVRTLRVRWPTSGAVQEFSAVELGRIYELVEGSEELRVLDLPRFDVRTVAGGHEGARTP